MTCAIIAVDTPSTREWEAMFQGCDYATYFHSPSWARAWQDFTGSRVRAAAERIRFADGRVALLPLSFETRGLLSRYVASPQGTFGGWISDAPLSPGQADALLAHLLEGRSSSLVWRMNPYDARAFDAGRRRGLRCRADETHALRLGPDAAPLLANFKNGYRSDVKKAINRGHISVERATTLEEWRAYYRVYEETLARWGHRSDEGYPWELFQTLFFQRSDAIVLWLARYDGAIVSGELCFYAKQHVVSWHAATLEKYLRSHVAKVQIFHVLQDACQRGLSWFDFNPSAGLAGVRTFKESFGARPLPAPLVYVDSTLKRMVRGVATSLRVPYAELDLRPLDQLVPPSPCESSPPTL